MATEGGVGAASVVVIDSAVWGGQRVVVGVPVVTEGEPGARVR
jgi:hypothetical protein